MANYDFNTINTVIPIEDVLAYHGIQPNAKGWYRLRPEDDTPSAHIDKAKIGNAIHDFGGGVIVGDRVYNTLNPISLTMYLNNCDAVKASQILGDAFGIQPLNKTHKEGNGLSDLEWKELGIQPDMASKNMDFYPEKYGAEKTSLYAEKYRISMEKLRTDDVKMYIKILRSRAIPHLFNLRNEYYREMYNQFSLAKAVDSSYDVNKILKDNMSEFSSLAKSLNRVENILYKAVKDTTIKFKFKVHDAAADFSKIVSGELAFEIGDCCYTDIKDEAYKGKVSICYSDVSLSEYHTLLNNGLDLFRVAAFQKGDRVKLAFLSSDATKFNYLIKALRSKEVDIVKVPQSNEYSRETNQMEYL